ncbi:MAG: phage holin family protein [Verrucomicrobia bacterium]|nr:MAG: phage holin family protein [Verrucomicrobiota bacterium]
MDRHPAVVLLVRWAITALGVFLAAELIPGIEYADNKALLIVAVLLGLFNAFLRPLLIFLALPFVILTLGIGILFINALLLMLAAKLVDGFIVAGFLPAFFGALLIGLINVLLGGVAGDSVRVVRYRRRKPRQDARDDVIDI